MDAGIDSGEAAGRAEHRYACFGLDVHSEIPLPELAGMPPPPATAARPRVVIRTGTIPAELTIVPGAGRARAIGCDTFLIDVKDTARYLVRGGAEIVVEPCAGGSALNLRLFLLGSAFGALCHQRGFLPLHANAVVVGGRAFAFAGRSGIGKSTLAAYFQTRGYQVLCDDVCVVSFDDEGRPMAWPGLPRLKLWRDAAETFGHDSRALERAIDGRDKYHVPLASTGDRGPYPLARIYLLRNVADGAPEAIEHLTAAPAVRALMANTYRRGFVRKMDLLDRSFQQATAVAHHAAVFSAARHRGFDVFEREAERLADHLRQPADSVSGAARALSA